MSIAQVSLKKINEDDEFVHLVKYIFTRMISAFIIVFGRRGTGKTEISLLIMEILNYFGKFKHFGTNVKIYASPFQIDHICDLINLTAWCESRRGRKLFLLDEAGRAFKRRKPMSAINVEIIDRLQILRKYKLSFIWATPDETYLDKTALGSDVLDGAFMKTKFDNPKYVEYDDHLEFFKLKFWEIPRTHIRFDTWDSADFVLGKRNVKTMFKDKDLQHLWRYATNEVSIKDSGLHPQTFRRILKKYLLESLKDRVTSH